MRVIDLLVVKVIFQHRFCPSQNEYSRERPLSSHGFRDGAKELPPKGITQDRKRYCLRFTEDVDFSMTESRGNAIVGVGK